MDSDETDSITSRADIQRKVDLLRQEQDAIEQRKHEDYEDATSYRRISDEIDLLEAEMSRLKLKATHGQG